MVESLDIAFVCDRAEPLYMGGYEHHIWEIARRLARVHRVTVYTSLPKRGVNHDGVEFERVAPYISYVGHSGTHSPVQSLGFAVMSSMLIRSLFRKDFIDILGIPYVHLPLLRARSVVERWNWGLTIWEAWYDYPYTSRTLSPAFHLVFRQLLRLGMVGNHKIIAGTNLTRRMIQLNYHIPDWRIRTVSPGIDLRTIGSTSASSIPVDVAYLGRLAPYKRVADLLRAIWLLRTKRFEVRTLVIGSGIQQGELRLLARSLGVSDLVEFLERASTAEIMSRLKAAKVFVMPSEREGYSIATLEAMACGAVPVVARPPQGEVFGVGEIVKHNVNGLHYPVGNVVALSDSIGQLLSDECLRDSLRRKALEFSSMCDWETRAETYTREVLLDGRSE